VVGPFEQDTQPAMLKEFDFEVHDVSARDDGNPSTNLEKEIARLLKEHGGTGLFGGGGAAYGANTRIPPKSPAARAAAQTREHGR